MLLVVCGRISPGRSLFVFSEAHLDFFFRVTDREPNIGSNHSRFFLTCRGLAEEPVPAVDYSAQSFLAIVLVYHRPGHRAIRLRRTKINFPSAQAVSR